MAVIQLIISVQHPPQYLSTTTEFFIYFLVILTFECGPSTC
jgi:hypothetical protein